MKFIIMTEKHNAEITISYERKNRAYLQYSLVNWVDSISIP
jgi:hypothetical protein